MYSDPDETDDEEERNRFTSWVTNGRDNDMDKSKKLLFDDKIRRPKRKA